jgi:hypothetical protein
MAALERASVDGDIIRSWDFSPNSCVQAEPAADNAEKFPVSTGACNCPPDKLADRFGYYGTGCKSRPART